MTNSTDRTDMPDMPADRLIFLFESTHAVIRAERLCRSQGIPCKAITAPREISSDCGIALELQQNREAALKNLLETDQITFTVYRPERKDI
ncbi:MAG: DUF3343 domain-containing protein [Chitinispirillaceae bacterium]|nr:DUF3343 domain-containing protein [Chitinispirillaceae bacterium]